MSAPTTPLEVYLGNGYQLCFIHLEKTGGSSLEAIVESYFASQEIYCRFARPQDMAGVSPQDAANFRFFHGHLPYEMMAGLLRPDAAFITLLREPVDRFVSHFYHRQRQAIPVDNPVAHRFLQMTLAEYVQAGEFRPLQQHCNYQAAFLGTDYGTGTPKQWLASRKRDKGRGGGPAGSWFSLDLRLAKERLETFAWVGLTERFQESLYLLSYVFGWPPVTAVHNRNVNPARPRLAQIDAQTLQHIAALNAADLELYAYAQELFERRLACMQWDLLERYGRAAQAHLQPPLPEDVLVNLLEQHYLQIFAQEHPPVVSFSWQSGSPLRGVGWYPLEQGEPNRWSGPGPDSTLDFPALLPAPVGGDFYLRFLVVAAITPQVLASLRLQVNGRPVPLSLERQPEGLVFTAYLPAGLLQDHPMTRLLFSLERTLSPHDLDLANADIRPLGLALRWLEVLPVQPVSF
ncbi:MAG: sulfotransferase family 2 domain-containing protein [Chloroflexota bacterium]